MEKTRFKFLKKLFFIAALLMGLFIITQLNNQVKAEGSATVDVTYVVEEGNQFVMSYFVGSKAQDIQLGNQNGKKFKGWHKDQACLEPFNFNLPLEATPLTLYAKWESITYTLNVHYGAAQPYELGVSFGVDVVVPEALQKEGQYIEGWYEDAGYLHRIEASELDNLNVEGSKDVYVKYENQTYLAIFKWFGGAEVKKIKYGDPIIAPVLASDHRQGHTFNGFGIADGATMPAQNMVYEATYTPLQYNIKFINNNGTVLFDQDLDFGSFPSIADPVSELSDPNYDYVFTGWSPVVTNVTGAAVYEAQYDKVGKIQSVEVEINGIKYIYEMPYGAPIVSLLSTQTVPEVEGYTFVGWVDQNNNPISDSAALTDPSIKIKANYQANVLDYNVIHKKQGLDGLYTDESLWETISKQGAVGSLTAAEAKTYEGFTLVGTVVNKEIKVGENNDIEILYSRNSYDVTFEVDGVQYGVTQSVKYEDFAATPAVPTKAGYTFKEWQVDGALANPATYQITKETKFVAVWTANEYTVIFDGNGNDGGTMASQTFTYDSAQALSLNAFTKTGYTFDGWKLGEQTYSDGEEVSNLAQSGSVTLVAQWVINKYDLSLSSNLTASVVPGPKVLTHGQELTINLPTFDPNTQTRELRINGVLQTLADSANTFVISEVTGDVDAVLVVIPKQFQVQFDSNSGSAVVPSSVTVNAGNKVDAAQIPADPSREGYNFLGWYLGESLFDFVNTSITSNITLVAKWEQKTFALTLPAEGGVTALVNNVEVSSGYLMPYGSELKLLVTDSNVILGNKKLQVNGSDAALDAGYTHVISSVLEAKVVSIVTLEQVSYSFVLNGGTAEGLDELSHAVNRGYSLSLPAQPTKEGHVFTGWTINSVPVTQWPYEVKDNVVITANFAVKEYDVTYNVSNLEVLTLKANGKVDHGTEITIKSTGASTVKEIQILGANNAVLAQFKDTDPGVDFTAGVTYVVNQNIKVVGIYQLPEGPITYTLTLPAAVTANPNQDSYAPDTEITLTISLGANEAVKSFKVAGVERKDQLVGNTYTFNITGNTVVTVLIEEVYNVSLGTGLSSVDPLTGLFAGEVVNIAIAIPAGKQIKELKVDNAPVTIAKDATSYQLTVSGNHSVEVTFEPIPATTYTITFYDEGKVNVLQTLTVAEGAMPAPDTPTKAATATHTYEFVGWSPDLVVATADASYEAVFTGTLRNYKLNLPASGVVADFADLNNVPVGTTVTLTITPPSGQQIAEVLVNGLDLGILVGNEYAFDMPAQESTVTVTYEAIPATTYTIRFYDEDGSTLLETLSVAEGVMPAPTVTPTKASTPQFSYTFKEWSPALVAASADADYRAVYTQTTRSYTITWKNYDDSVLETDEGVSYGATPEYNGATPTKPASATHTYEFSGWLPAVGTVVGDQEYVAQFNAVEIPPTNPETEQLLFSYNFLDGGDNNNQTYANTDLTTNVSYAEDNPGGNSGTTEWKADYANLSLTNATRLGGKLVSTENGSPNSNMRTNFNFDKKITKVEILGATTFGTASNLTAIYLQSSSDNGVTWTTVASTTKVLSTIVFDNLNIAAGSRIKVAIELSASESNSGLAFTGIKVHGMVVTTPLTDAEKVAADKAALDITPTTITSETQYITLPSSGSNGSSITWQSQNTAILNHNGTVAALPAAQTNVNLVATIQSGSASDTKTFVITVHPENATPPATSTTVTASYSGATINMTGNNDAVLLGLDDTLFTVTSDKGEAQNHIGLNTEGQIRLYSVRATGEGNTLSVSIAAGYKITDVKITYGSTTAASVLTLGTQVINLTAAEQKSATLVYDALDITSFSIKNAHTGGTSNTQTYIISIEITYIPI